MAQRFKIAVSGETVYVGKRDGQLVQSLDGGDTWNDKTANLPLPVVSFNQIVFADATVHVATDRGVFSSKDGVVWHTITDNAGESIIIKALATTEDTVYGANDDGIYQLEGETGTWEQIVPEIPDAITSLVVDKDAFYVGTEHRGVLRLERGQSVNVYSYRKQSAIGKEAVGKEAADSHSSETRHTSPFGEKLMLTTLIRRELLDNLMTFRFAAAVLIMLLLVVATTAVLIRDYERRLASYDTAIKKHQQEMLEETTYSAARLTVDRPPQPVEHL